MAGEMISVATSVGVEAGGMAVVSAMPAISNVSPSVSIESTPSVSLARVPGFVPFEIGPNLSPDKMSGNPLIDTGWVTLAQRQPSSVEPLFPKNYSVVGEAEKVAEIAWNSHETALVNKATAWAAYFGTFGIHVAPEKEVVEQKSNILMHFSDERAKGIEDASLSDSLDSSSDQAIAEKVIALAKEIGKPEIVNEVNTLLLERTNQVEDGKQVENALENKNKIDPLKNEEPETEERLDNEEKLQEEKPFEPPVLHLPREESGVTNQRKELLNVLVDEEEKDAAAAGRRMNSVVIANRYEKNAQRSTARKQLGIGSEEEGILTTASGIASSSASTAGAMLAASIPLVTNGVILAEYGPIASDKEVHDAIGSQFHAGSRRNLFGGST